MLSIEFPRYIKYGVPLKFRHVLTGNALHSHKINYCGGSKQQEVTCYDSRDENDWWIVKGPHGDSRYNDQIGAKVLNFSVIRLEHLLTGKNLHSENDFQSPSSHQVETSCFGENGIGNAKDNWRLEIVNAPNEAPWRFEHRFILINVESGNSLHSHRNHRTNSYQQEVTCYTIRDENDLWQVETIA